MSLAFFRKITENKKEAAEAIAVNTIRAIAIFAAIKANPKPSVQKVASNANVTIPKMKNVIFLFLAFLIFEFPFSLI